MEFQIEPEVVYVLDKNENHIAEFKKDDRDTIINPRIKKTQNAESTLTFSISINNPKWEQIKNPENLYIVEDMVFSTNFDGSFNETISDNGEELVTVTAYERQQLLSRKYVRVWNSTTGFDIADTFMVVILSNGNLPLRNNGKEVVSAFEPGTSGYALDGLLYGTGWTTGTCDVEGKFDLETDMTDIYENIMKVQELWGGILVFDSLNKKVHHRDETKYLPYSGYEVKYAKNMQSSEKMYNNKSASKKDVDNVIRVLKENDLINDKMLILDTIEYGNERNIGKNKIIAELAKKGIFSENLSSISFPYNIERRKAHNNLYKLEKKYDKYSYEQKKQHIYRNLLSLGFDNDIALEALNFLSKPVEKEEKNKLDKDFVKTYMHFKNKYEGYELKNKVVTSLRNKGYKTKDILNKWEKIYGENDY